MTYELSEKLKGIVGSDWVISEKEAMLDYLVDETLPTVCPEPAAEVVLVKPATTEEISDILKIANEWKVPVFPRGGGTGLVGGAVPTTKGIVLSLERMDRVIEVDRENLMVVVEAGVRLEKLMEVADRAGLLFPPHPGDLAAQVGGLIACNAGGARAVRYGVTRNYVKGLEVVLPTGEVLALGGKLMKDVAGYDLMQLLIGSQGTLCIITKATIRLYPKFKETATLIIPFDTSHQAFRSVPIILQKGTIPLAIEYVEKKLMQESAEHLGKKWPVKEGENCLIAIITGNSKEEIYLEAERIDKIARKNSSVDTFVIESRKEQRDILKVRSNIYSILKPYSMDILDVAVPPAAMVKLIEAIDRIAEKYNMKTPVFGHAGDGNLHIHILTKKAGGIVEGCLKPVKKEIYDIAQTLGGTITGEHGIGKIRVKSFKQYSDKKSIEIMRKMKCIFDPNGVLNPGAVLPSAIPRQQEGAR